MKGAGRYGNVKKTEVDGIVFASGREAHRYQELKLLQRACLIRDLELQPRYPITIAGVEIRYCGSNRHLTYVADFRYFDCKHLKTVIEDVKMQQHRDPVYKIKRALMRAMGHTITEY
jgi:hypothetical protein